MEIVFCITPEDRFFKPAAADVAGILKLLVTEDYVDNDDVYLDIAYDNGHHRPGASDMTTVADVVAELEGADDLELTDFSVENIRGTNRIPELFENCDQKNLSLMGWLAVRVFEEAYPLLDSEEGHRIRCGFCGHEMDQQEWTAEDRLWRCPACDRLEEMHALDFSPPVEFARLIIEISDLAFTEAPPLLKQDNEFMGEIGGILGCELKPVWYRM